MIIYSYTNENLSAIVNDSSTLLINALVIDGVLTEDQAKTITEKYAVVIANPSMWGKLISKLISDEPDKPYIKVVKLV